MGCEQLWRDCGLLFMVSDGLSWVLLGPHRGWVGVSVWPVPRQSVRHLVKDKLPNPLIVPHWVAASAPDPISLSLHRSASSANIQSIFHATNRGIMLQRGLPHKFYYSTQVLNTPSCRAVPAVMYTPVFLFSDHDLCACRFYYIKECEQWYVKCCMSTWAEDSLPCLALTYTCSALVHFTPTGHGCHPSLSLSLCLFAFSFYQTALPASVNSLMWSPDPSLFLSLRPLIVTSSASSPDSGPMLPLLCSGFRITQTNPTPVL